MKTTRLRALCAALAAALLCTALCGCQSRQPRVELVYFYDSPCASCDEETDFRALLKEQTQDLQAFRACGLRCVNTFREGTDELERLAKERGLENPGQYKDVLFIGAHVLTGDAIKKGLRQFYWQAVGLGSEKNVVEYYYREDCPDCQQLKNDVTPWLASITDRPVVRIDTTDPQTKQDFRALADRIKLPDDRYQIPYLIDGGVHYSGNAEILAHIGAS